MNSIQIKYNEICKLTASQLFYQNHIYARYIINPVLDIEFVAAEETIILMQRMNLLVRNINTIGGVIVLAQTEGKSGLNDLLRFTANAGDKLTFFMQLKNTSFLNFNALPSAFSSDQFFYFSNDVADNLAARNKLHLTKDAAGVKSTNDMVKRIGPVYRYLHNAIVVAGSAKVKHLLTGAILNVKTILNENGKAHLQFDLSPMPLGKCQLLINNLVVDEFYYQGNNLPALTFGVVELQLSAAIMGNYRIIEADRSLTPERPLFSINFINRSTIWRYIIQLQTNSPLYLEMAALPAADKIDFLQHLAITCNDTSISFTQTNVTDTTIIYESVNPLALQEKYFSSTSIASQPLNLVLKKYNGIVAKEAAVKTDLPYPPTNMYNALNDPLIYSDIFLTL
jgi:hypothetical protein